MGNEAAEMGGHVSAEEMKPRHEGGKSGAAKSVAPEDESGTEPTTGQQGLREMPGSQPWREQQSPCSLGPICKDRGLDLLF